jgi:hypothetical protein
MKKRILSLFLVLSVMLTAVPAVTAQEGFVCPACDMPWQYNVCSSACAYRLGDVNGDGRITILDMLEILMYLAGINSAIFDTATGEYNMLARRAADINQDGVIDMNDFIEIGAYLTGSPSILSGNQADVIFIT